MPDARPHVARPILHLDVDGVLLGKDGRGGAGVCLARHAEEFLAHCVARFDCRWLTTHCRHGDAGAVMGLLARYADEAFLELAAAVRPAAWRTLKTEAIDFRSDFHLVDDGLLQAEEALLAAHGVLDRWIRADTRARPDDLARVLELLRERTGPG